jgi:DNA polymerase (family 10)
MINHDIAKILDQMGALLELCGENRFRILAYRNAAETLAHHPSDLKTLCREDQLKIKGVGKGICDIIEEFKATGRVREHEKLLKKFPAGVLDVMNLPGLGPKRAALLYSKLGIESVSALKAAVEKGKLEGLAGFGKKTAENILANIAWSSESGNRLLILSALDQAKEVQEFLEKSPVIKNSALAGSARRWKETVGDLDFLSTSAQPEKAISAFLALPFIHRVLAEGPT